MAGLSVFLYYLIRRNMCQRFYGYIALSVLANILPSHSDNTFKNLSRTKRFLIFPDGSSLQLGTKLAQPENKVNRLFLVFCFTIPISGKADIFTIGWTAALAWELPSEPIHLFKKKVQGMERVDKPGSVSSGGWSVQKASSSTSDSIKNTYTASAIKDSLTAPGYSKIRYNGKPDTSYREYLRGKYVDYRPIYDALDLKTPFKSNIVMKEPSSFYEHPVYKEVHRRTRRDLFAKIEKFLDAQRQNGKACLLKAICEVTQRPANHVGTFMEEIIKAIFKIKQHKNNEGEDEYDSAADEKHNCTERYSRCTSSVWGLL
ncbi:uncharacterized protein LOC116167098 [Photinus pyralis]|uniref:uncharacterized protein LOC116167098 n=1 Tax=Photinus pyralis TaxID=7054 RepID=UPI0012672EDC|nr:uncharacterized protein LOC116167098 [Photinus pyralis]